MGEMESLYEKASLEGGGERSEAEKEAHCSLFTREQTERASAQVKQKFFKFFPADCSPINEGRYSRDNPELNARGKTSSAMSVDGSMQSIPSCVHVPAFGENMCTDFNDDPY